MPMDTIVDEDIPLDAKKVKLRSRSITDKAFRSFSIAIRLHSHTATQQLITTMK